MDKNTQQEVTLACIALLQQNAADEEKARKRNGLPTPLTKGEAITMLLKAGSDPDITFDDVTDALDLIYQRSKIASQTRQWVLQLLLDLLGREDITVRDVTWVAYALYSLSVPGSQAQYEAIQKLLELAKRRDIPWADTVEAAFLLCRLSPRGSEEHQQAVEMLQEQSHWPDATAAQAQEAIIALSHAGGYRSKEWYLAIQMLLELTHWPDPTFEDALVIDDNGVSLDSGKALIRKQQEAKEQMWKTVAQRPDLTSEQRLQVDQILQNYQNWLALKV